MLCLPELKATREQIPPSLSGLADYWSCWHGERAYSSVGMLVRRACGPEEPAFTHPDFDHETRIVSAVVAVSERSCVAVSERPCVAGSGALGPSVGARALCSRQPGGPHMTALIRPVVDCRLYSRFR